METHIVNKSVQNVILKRSTMADVAAAARVSRTTVSLAFSGRRPISTRVKNRIFEEAKRLNFHPHQGAKMLRMGRTQRLMLVYPEAYALGSYREATLIEEAANQLGYKVFSTGLGDNPSEYREFLRDLVLGQADGIIILDIRVPKELVLELSQDNHIILSPYQFIEGHEWLRGVDLDQNAFGELFQYLYDLGHREYGMIWSNKPVALDLPDIADKFFREKNLKLSPEREIQRCKSIEHGKAIAKEMLTRCPEITALVCTGDDFAFGAMSAAHELGLRVPEDISIAGGTDSSFGLVSTPTLTTLSRPYRDVCYAWVKNIVDRIEGREPSPLITMPMELVVRRSTGVVRSK